MSTADTQWTTALAYQEQLDKLEAERDAAVERAERAEKETENALALIGEVACGGTDDCYELRSWAMSRLGFKVPDRAGPSLTQELDTLQARLDALIEACEKNSPRPSWLREALAVAKGEKP